MIKLEILHRRKKEFFSLLVKLGGEKMGFEPLSWIGLDWN